MAVTFTNRIGLTYYLRKTKTKKGNPSYFFTTKQDAKGNLVKQIPDGYEIYEHPENAQVFLRKIRPQQISDIEKHLVEQAIKKLTGTKRYLVYCKDEFITIYESNADFGNVKNIFGDFLNGPTIPPGINPDNVLRDNASIYDQYYSAMMRFCLDNKEKRTFTVERFCFRGSIEDWIYLDGPDILKKLNTKYIKLLGTDEFFEAPFY